MDPESGKTMLKLNFNQRIFMYLFKPPKITVKISCYTSVLKTVSNSDVLSEIFRGFVCINVNILISVVNVLLTM